MTPPADALRSDDAGLPAEIESMKTRILALEREVRYLRHHLEQSDPAGRPPFRTPDFVTIGEGSRIGRGVTMSATERAPISVGTRTRILRGAEILGPTSIGDRVFLNRDVYIRAQCNAEGSSSATR